MACEVAKEVVWLRKFYTDLEVIPDMEKPLILYCDNSGAVANSKESRSHKRGNSIVLSKKQVWVTWKAFSTRG